MARLGDGRVAPVRGGEAQPEAVPKGATGKRATGHLTRSQSVDHSKTRSSDGEDHGHTHPSTHST